MLPIKILGCFRSNLSFFGGDAQLIADFAYLQYISSLDCEMTFYTKVE